MVGTGTPSAARGAAAIQSAIARPNTVYRRTHRRASWRRPRLPAQPSPFHRGVSSMMLSPCTLRDVTMGKSWVGGPVGSTYCKLFSSSSSTRSHTWSRQLPSARRRSCHFVLLVRSGPDRRGPSISPSQTEVRPCLDLIAWNVFIPVAYRSGSEGPWIARQLVIQSLLIVSASKPVEVAGHPRAIFDMASAPAGGADSSGGGGDGATDFAQVRPPLRRRGHLQSHTPPYGSTTTYR